MRKINNNLKFGLVMLTLLALIAIFAPQITIFSPTQIDLKNELCKPNTTHYLGCDSNGSDIFSILVYGARTSLEVGLFATFMSVIIGLILGSIAGWFGGWLDSLLMRILDCVFAFPGIILAIAIASVLGPSKYNVILSLVITGWASYARIVRGETLNIKTKEYIESAVAIGATKKRILFIYIWPNLISPLIITASFGIAGAILTESSLSFLGVGSAQGTPSWGTLLSYGKEVLVEAPHVATVPGIAIMYTVLSFHFIGEGLRIYFDPKNS